MIPARQSMINAAQELEAIGHRHGWGLPPTVGIIFYTEPGLQCEPFPTQPGDLYPGEELEQALLALADRMMVNSVTARAAAIPGQFTAAADATCGMWLVGEGELHQRTETADGRVAKVTVDRIRTCVLVDCGGIVYQVLRKEGKPPATDVYEPGDPFRQSSGALVDALRRMILSVGAGMSIGAIDMVRVGMAGVHDAP